MASSVAKERQNDRDKKKKKGGPQTKMVEQQILRQWRWKHRKQLDKGKWEGNCWED